MSSIKDVLNMIKKKKKTKLDSYTLTIIEDGRVKVVFDLNRPLWNARFISDHAIVGLHTITNGRKGIKFVKATTGSRGIFNRDCDHYLQLTYNFGTILIEFNMIGYTEGVYDIDSKYVTATYEVKKSPSVGSMYETLVTVEIKCEQGFDKLENLEDK